jgi:hypothetical protein
MTFLLYLSLLNVDVPYQNYCDLSNAAQRYWAIQKKCVRQAGLLGICNELLGESESEGYSAMRDIVEESKRDLH